MKTSTSLVALLFVGAVTTFGCSKKTTNNVTPVAPTEPASTTTSSTTTTTEPAPAPEPETKSTTTTTTTTPAK